MLKRLLNVIDLKLKSMELLLVTQVKQAARVAHGHYTGAAQAAEDAAKTVEEKIKHGL